MGSSRDLLRAPSAEKIGRIATAGGTNVYQIRRIRPRRVDGRLRRFLT